MARYEAGETLASIAKTYDCSPPAISYIISRSRARRADTPVTHPAAEPQLVKIHHDEPAHRSGAHPGVGAAEPVALSDTNHASGLQPRAGNGGGESIGVNDLFRGPAAGNGFGNGSGAPHPAEADHDRGGLPALPSAVSHPAAAPTQSVPPHAAEHRPKLHLSLGNGHANHPPQANGRAPSERYEDGPHGMNSDSAGDGFGARREPQPAAPSYRADEYRPYQSEPQRHGYPQPAITRPTPGGNGGAAVNNGTGAYLDKELRVRVDGDIAAFLSAFDAALSEDSQQNRSALREATDRLLRAGARTRIELERLEARVPLPQRESAGRLEPAWRPR